MDEIVTESDDTTVVVTVPQDDTPEPVVDAGDTTVVVTAPADDTGDTNRAVDTAVELERLRTELADVRREMFDAQTRAAEAMDAALEAAEPEPEPEPEPAPMVEDVPPGRTGHWLTRSFSEWR